MTDLNQADWQEADTNNTSAPPNGAPAGILPSQVEPILRAMRGSSKRFYNQIGPTVTSAGTANAQTLTHTQARTALVAGDRFAFIVGAALTNSGATTLNVDALGAKSVVWHGAALVGGELVAGRVAEVAFDGTNMVLLNSQLEVSSATLATVATTGAAANLTGLAAVATSGSASDLGAGTLPPARLAGLNQISSALGADVLLNNTALFFSGPTILQGTTGTWFVSGQVTLADSATAADFLVTLWDATTVIASAKASLSKVGGWVVVSLSGVISAPTGNLRLDVRDLTSTSGAIKFNATGNSRDSYLCAFRIA